MERIDLSVGSGGRSMHKFIREVVVRHLGVSGPTSLEDSVLLCLEGEIGFTTDSFVITPLFFPGGDIGKLAVAGTVNDLVVSGVRPLYLSLSLIIEEGFPMGEMERILVSIRETSGRAEVKVVTGDTKVVGRGQADGLYINTAGVGRVVKSGRIARMAEGDRVIVTGPVGDHGASVMIARKEFGFEGSCESDCRAIVDLLPLWEMEGVKWMRDITRGGVATVTCELASESGFSIFLEEGRIPLSPPVRAIAEILGIDPLYLPSEGKAAIVVAPEAEEGVLGFLREREFFADAAAVGTVRKREKLADVVLKTISGGYRVLEPLTGELLPRIC